MIWTIIYVIGIILAILAVIGILKMKISILWKIIVAILVLATSWVGVIVYYLILKNNLEKWLG